MIRPLGRGTIRVLGVVAAAAATASLVPWTAGSTGPSGLIVALAAGVAALVPEVLALRSLLGRSGDRPRPPDGARPADGIVDRSGMAGVRSEPNEEDPGWRRFRAIEPDGPPPTRLVRAVPPPLGRVALISVFVGRDGRDWTDPEIARGHRALERAGAWLEREAACWDAPVNILLPDVYFQGRDDADDPVELSYQAEGDDFGPMEAGAAFKGIASASRVAAGLGFADVVDLAGRVEPRVDADVRVWLFHILRSGRSLAIPATDPEAPGIGLAICHAREASFPRPLDGPGRVDPVTVVHEVLHLFGASDKYGTRLEAYPRGSVGARDVMRLDHATLDRLVVGPLTAAEIGWLGRVGDRRRKPPAATEAGRGGRE
ncbi:hypothetical protein TA3x_003436 [Tundrisphaera sp. TA3]|uniref:hypothetical protein n=1 Tax=Tundrisphaera sp. TA3 TaxID=3435775 RepID=UPI003EBBC778